MRSRVSMLRCTCSISTREIFVIIWSPLSGFTGQWSWPQCPRGPPPHPGPTPLLSSRVHSERGVRSRGSYFVYFFLKYTTTVANRRENIFHVVMYHENKVYSIDAHLRFRFSAQARQAIGGKVPKGRTPKGCQLAVFSVERLFLISDTSIQR